MGAVYNTIETLLNEHAVSKMTGMSLASVRRWRLLRQGPKYIKIGAAVRYKPEDVTAWLNSRPTGGDAKVPDGLRKNRKSGAGYVACCPVHPDNNPSLCPRDPDTAVVQAEVT